LCHNGEKQEAQLLDQDDFINEYDPSDALGVIGAQPEQLKHAFKLAAGLKKPQNIVLAGMGGSALEGEFVASWLVDQLPVSFEIVREYDLPAYVSEQTLVVISSYSGNTEETLSALLQAEKRGAQIVILTAGGELKEVAAKKGYALLEVPGGLQPRLAVCYGIAALATLLEALGLAEGLLDQLTRTADWLTPHILSWLADVPTEKNQAKQIAEAVFGFPVVVYGSPVMAMPAHKWKIDFNENAKNLAFWNQFSELNHNEFTGWQHPSERKFKVVELRSSFDNERIVKRFEISNKLLAGQMPTPIQVQAQGDTKLEQMLWTIFLGDYVSAYVAFLNKTDPTPVDLVEKLKKELG
jgi:glucose/mannose-6-phosphate isomerase